MLNQKIKLDTFQSLMELDHSSSPSPLSTKSIDFALNDFNNKTDGLSIQRIFPSSYRRAIINIKEGKKDFLNQLDASKDFDETYLTHNSKMMVEKLYEYSNLDICDQENILKFCLAAGWHSKVAHLCKEKTPSMTLFQNLCHGIAEYTLSIEQKIPLNFERLAQISTFEASPHNASVQVRAALLLVVYFAKFEKNQPLCELWSHIASENLTKMQIHSDYFTEFELTYYRSRLLRSISYVPFLKGMLQMTSSIMNDCEELGKHLLYLASNPREKLIAKENLLNIYQSRSKEYLALKNYEKSDEYLNRKLLLDPYESSTYFEKGNSLLHKCKWEKALDNFRISGEYSVDCLSSLRQMAFCYQQLGEHDLSRDCLNEVKVILGEVEA